MKGSSKPFFFFFFFNHDAFQEHTKEELDSWKIVRVSEDFRVIALGLPVPKYKGNPLDPPLRSRFQARDIYYLPFKVNTGFCRLPNAKISQSDKKERGRARFSSFALR